MIQIPMASTEIVSANILGVGVGTNCPKGGDGGHGGRTIFNLKDEAGTALWVGINSGELQDVNSVQIVLAGDCECDTFMQALKFAFKNLQAQTKMKLYEVD